jgi:2-polyprenyl-6-methoxyphenol hydroxylase-like FAD-dependent oxidoreductase
MLDACELALALANHHTVDDAIDAYEKTMLPRSHEMQQLLDNGAEGLLSTELPDFVTDAAETEVPRPTSAE